MSQTRPDASRTCSAFGRSFRSGFAGGYSPEGSAHGCLSPSGYLQGRTGLPSRGFTFEGAAESDVSAVRVAFRASDGVAHERLAVVARALDPRTLRAVGIDEPFGIWRVTLPAGATDVHARGFDARGSLAWTAADPTATRERARPRPER